MSVEQFIEEALKLGGAVAKLRKAMEHSPEMGIEYNAAWRELTRAGHALHNARLEAEGARERRD